MVQRGPVPASVPHLRMWLDGGIEASKQDQLTSQASAG